MAFVWSKPEGRSAAIRDQGKKFSISPDAYQSDLGQAFKQLHKELLDEMMAKERRFGSAVEEG